ncbi:MAG: MBL fold metallo-hydrolase [Acidimicrobiia bacterium]
MELTVLGCSGSYGAPPGGACSGYLLREGDTAIWMDCGNGTFPLLQQHIDPTELSAVVITHEHPDHCVDIYGLHVMLRYAAEQDGLPVFAPAGAEQRLGGIVASWGDTFEWTSIHDGDKARVGGVDLRFSRTDHPPPTYAVEASAGGRRLVYTADTGPEWSVDAFGAGADLVLSEASYLHDNIPIAIHLSAHQAGLAAREARAHRLLLTHIWPQVDPEASVAEGSEAFGEPVTLAVPHLITEI